MSKPPHAELPVNPLNCRFLTNPVLLKLLCMHCKCKLNPIESLHQSFHLGQICSISHWYSTQENAIKFSIKPSACHWSTRCYSVSLQRYADAWNANEQMIWVGPTDQNWAWWAKNLTTQWSPDSQNADNEMWNGFKYFPLICWAACCWLAIAWHGQYYCISMQSFGNLWKHKGPTFSFAFTPQCPSSLL